MPPKQNFNLFSTDSPQSDRMQEAADGYDPEEDQSDDYDPDECRHPEEDDDE